MSKNNTVEKSEQTSSHGGPRGNKFEKPKDFKGTFKRLFSMLMDSKVALAIVLVCSVVGTIFNVVSPRVLGDAVTNIAQSVSSTGKVNFDTLDEFIFKLIGLYLLSLAFQLVSGVVISRISQKLTFDLRTQVNEKFNKLPLKYYDENKIGNTISRCTNDIDTISNTLNQSMPQIISSFVTFFGTIYMMLTISVKLSLISFLLVPVSLAFVALVVKKSQKHFKRQQKYIGELNAHVEEAYSGMQVIKGNNYEQKSMSNFEEINENLAKTGLTAQFYSALMMPTILFVGNLGFVAVTLFGAIFVSRGTMVIGDVLSSIQYNRNFTQPLSQLSQISSVLQSTAAAAERVFELLDEQEEEDVVEEIDLGEIKGNVKFNHVKFGYSDDNILVDDFNCEIYPGRKIAIVGPTGAGKTTILKLLMRYYEIQGGNIQIDDIDIKTMPRHQLRSLFGIVLQDTWLFSGTILENLKYGRTDATFDEVVAACKLAHIHHFILTLPDGYNTMLNEDVSNMSEGQTQLLTIARAILADPKIMILDEATSNVDTRTEKLIQDATYKLMENRTSFVIAHRLSTILDSDLILVMDQGDIVEMGNHKELIAENGFYASLYNSQFND